MPIRRLFSENIKLFFQLFIATVMGDFGEPNVKPEPMVLERSDKTSRALGAC